LQEKYVLFTYLEEGTKDNKTSKIQNGKSHCTDLTKDDFSTKNNTQTFKTSPNNNLVKIITTNYLQF